MKQALTLKEDGSGTVDLRYSLDLAAVAALTPPGGPDALPAITDADIRRDLAAYRPFGVRVLATQVNEEAGRRNVVIRLGFDDVRTLALTSFFADNRLTLTQRGDGGWLLEQRLVPPEAGELDVDLRPPGQGASEGFPEGFQAEFTVTVPGKILESNAGAVEGRTARWSMGGESKPDAIRFARGEPMRLLFDGAGLALQEPQRMSIRLPAPE